MTNETDDKEKRVQQFLDLNHKSTGGKEAADKSHWQVPFYFRTNLPLNLHLETSFHQGNNAFGGKNDIGFADLGIFFPAFIRSSGKVKSKLVGNISARKIYLNGLLR